MQQAFSGLAAWVQSLSTSEYWIGIAVLTALTLYAFSNLYQGLHRIRLFENIPTSKIRSAAQGYIELNGEAKSLTSETIMAPLSRKPCVWYNYRIEEKVHEYDGKRMRSRWKVVKQGESQKPFALQDQTGVCEVNPIGAEVYSKYQKSWNQPGMPPKRYSEKLLLEQDLLYVIGHFNSRHHHRNIDKRSETAELLKSWKADQATLKSRYDKNNDGEISTAEWEQARQDAEKQVDEKVVANQFAERLSVMEQTDNAKQPYIISALPEGVLIKKYQWRVRLSMVAFLLLGIIVIWAMNARMSV